MEINCSDFEIKIIRQHWIRDNGEYDMADLCSHGEVLIRIGNEILSDESHGSWTLSAAGLYLLRTLAEDYSIGQFENPLVPCCGHMMIPSKEDENYVTIIGCPNGIDWNVKHDNGYVVLESKEGTIRKLYFKEYLDIVIHFVNEIELFYESPNQKSPHKDEVSGFEEFWREWKERKSKLGN